MKTQIWTRWWMWKQMKSKSLELVLLFVLQWCCDESDQSVSCLLRAEIRALGRVGGVQIRQWVVHRDGSKGATWYSQQLKPLFRLSVIEGFSPAVGTNCISVDWLYNCVSAGFSAEQTSSHHVSAGCPVLWLDQVRQLWSVHNLFISSCDVVENDEGEKL